MDGISVIICCYNSAKRLPETLQHIAAQQTKTDLQWEIVVVDNNSNDNTGKVAISEWAKYGLQQVGFKVVLESNPGLIYARERGLKEIKYDFLVFCDDDNWLDANYIQNAYNILNVNPDIAILGGVNVGVFENGIEPDWFITFASSYAIGVQGKGPLELLEGERYIVGAGTAFNKRAYDYAVAHGFSTYLTGRQGKKVIGGEDVEICYIMKLCGYKVAFSNLLHLQHYMPQNRLTKQYLTNMWHQYPASWLIFEAYKVFLVEPKKDVNIYLAKTFWKKHYRTEISKMLKMFPYYLINKLKGKPERYLFYETYLKYHYYGLHNTGIITKVIVELHSKVLRLPA